MTEQDDTGTTLPLAEGFAPATAEQWWGLVGAVLRRSGGLAEAPDPATAEAMLSTTTYDGVRIRPLYTADDAAPDSGFPGVAPYVRGSRPTGRGKEGWDVRQYFADPDATATRQAVLTDLENGVTSLWLGVGAGGIAAADLPEVLTDVLLDLAPVVLDAGAGTADAAPQLMALWRDRLTDPAAALGNLGLDPLAVQARTGASADLSALEPLVSRCLGEHPRVRAMTVDALAYHDAGGSDAQELGCVARRRRRLPAGAGRRAASPPTSPAGSSSSVTPQRRTSSSPSPSCAPRAGSGPGSPSCPACRRPRAGSVQHAVTVRVDDDPARPLGEHAAHHRSPASAPRSAAPRPSPSCRSTPRSGCRRRSRAASPATPSRCWPRSPTSPGSPTRPVAPGTSRRSPRSWPRSAWAWFQRDRACRWPGRRPRLRSRRGPARATWRRCAPSGRAHREDPDHRRQRVPATSARSRCSASRSAAAAPARAACPVRRSAAFEALRDRAAALAGAPARAARVPGQPRAPAHPRRAGRLRQQPVLGRRHRVDPGEGGSAQEVVAAFRASGATAACLCANDKVYAEQGTEVAAALKEAGATRLALAGQPVPRAGLPAAGVDAFLFSGCDAVDLLGRTLDDLGAPA